jgi:GLPGLI family protein
MTKFVKVLLIVFTCMISEVKAQEFQGLATYKTQRKVDIKIDSTQVGGMQDEIMAMLKKQFEKTYVLTFNKSESIYKEDESLAPPSTGGSMVFISGVGGSGELYKNIKKQRFVQQSDLLGKVFLIQDSLKVNPWKLQGDTKNIGEYTCYKATLEREVDSDIFSGEVSKITQTVTAWYTPQIPVSNGPEEFQGLPGLILELSYDSQTILCSKVLLNPTKQVTIKEPTSGTTVTQNEFDTIMAKKMKEMESQYSQDDGEGNSFKIQIGN